jgi:S1-C subfamily serine protease
VITTFDGAPIGHARELARALDRRKPGDAVSVGYRRRGEGRTARVELDASDDTPPALTRRDRGARVPLGLSASDSPGGARIDAVDPRSAAADDLTAGDLILEVNGDAVRGGAQLAARVRATPSGGDLLLRVRREGATRYVVIQAP